jgi:hypothetical protein
MPPRSGTRPLVLTVVGTLLALVIALGLGGWLLWRSVFPPPNGSKARDEVQRYYDKQWPGVVEVSGCNYLEDPEGSEFDRYQCRIHLRCRNSIVFSVPRASTFGHLDFDAMPLSGEPQKPGRSPHCVDGP